MNNVKAIQKINEAELLSGSKKSWHDMYSHSAYVFVGGLNYDLTEGDVLAVFSQYGEIVNINLVRDKKTGKPKGFCFLCYDDQRSTVLAVDNLNGIKLCGRTIRVDHVSQYRRPKDESGNEIVEKGCAPKTPTPSPSPSPPPSPQLVEEKKKVKDKKKKKKLKLKKKHRSSETDSDVEEHRFYNKLEKIRDTSKQCIGSRERTKGPGDDVAKESGPYRRMKNPTGKDQHVSPSSPLRYRSTATKRSQKDRHSDSSHRYREARSRSRSRSRDRKGDRRQRNRSREREREHRESRRKDSDRVGRTKYAHH